MVTRAGTLAVSIDGNRLNLPLDVRNNLKLFHEFSRGDNALGLGRPARAAVSAAVLYSLAGNGIGVVDMGAVRPPQTLDEVRAVAPIAAVLGALSAQAAEVNGAGGSRSVKRFTEAARSTPQAQQAFLAELGLHILGWLRNCEAHVWFELPDIVQGGLTGAIVSEAVSAAVDALVAAEGTAFAVTDDGELVRLIATTRPEAVIARGFNQIFTEYSPHSGRI